MMGVWKKYILVLVLAAVTCGWAEQYYHKDNLFESGIGAKPLALGKAYTAVTGDVNALLFNPASTARLNTPQMVGLKSKRLVDLDQYTFLAAYPLGENRGVVGFGYLELSLPKILLADPDLDLATGQTQVGGKASYTEKAYLLNYSRAISERTAWGINYKYYRNDFNPEFAKRDFYDTYQANGSDLDLGITHMVHEKLIIGAAYHNAFGKMKWTTGTEEKIMNKLKLGMNYKFDPGFLQSELFVDHEFPGVGQSLSHIGYQGKIYEQFSIRYGLNQRVWADTVKFSNIMGVGLNLYGAELDYTYYPDFGESVDPKHFFSITYTFGSVAPPKVYAPEPEKKVTVEQTEPRKISQDNWPAGYEPEEISKPDLLAY